MSLKFSPSDINQHLKTLYKLTLECNSVFETGVRGVVSSWAFLNGLKNKELSLINQINDLDFKNSLLSDNLDLDYIETLIRERFLYGKKNEKIYIIKKNDTKN